MEDYDPAAEEEEEEEGPEDEGIEALRVRALSRNPEPSRSARRGRPRGGPSSSGVPRALPRVEPTAWSWPDDLIPGLNRRAMPSEDSWDKVVRFLRDQGLIVGRVAVEEVTVGRQGVGRECANTIWQALRGACTCEQSQEHTCPDSCLTPCPACSAQRKVRTLRLPDVHTTESEAKSRRLRIFIRASLTILGVLQECGGREARQEVEKALSTAFCCSVKRMQQVASLGYLASVCPSLYEIGGLAGRGQWAQFFVQMSKLGVAIKAQLTQPARAAVARAFFQRLRREEGIDESWLNILTPGEW